MRIEIQKLSPYHIDEFIELLDLFEEVFEIKNVQAPSRMYLEGLLEKEDFYVFVAVSEGKIVGGLTAYSLMQYYSETPLVYIYDIAVSKRFQNKGIGKKLILGIKDYCQETDVEEIFVHAIETDEHLLDFYRSTGAQSQKVVHFYYPMG
ncbi:GNAT family N-acetyltransferase [uncultured Cytophaga sp.]|uniref:GNAT family N-acetyltransferase n=1 Tax=uncultured Cytophaga sp. TaxID=160238 RepID=UPI00262CFD71|nr:GNAT family N-acetyltransferase [uncultured Cytophaga sp.]